MHLAHRVSGRVRNEMLLSLRPMLHDVLHHEISPAMTAQAENVIQQLFDERLQLVRATVFYQSLHDTTSKFMPGSEERPIRVLHDLIDYELHVA